MNDQNDPRCTMHHIRRGRCVLASGHDGKHRWEHDRIIGRKQPQRASMKPPEAMRHAG